MKKMISRRNFLTAAGVVAAAGVLTACGGSSSSTAASSTAASAAGSAAASGDTIKIGVMGPLTGDASVYGQAVVNGASLYLKQVNADGGINGKQIEILTEDEQGDATQAVNCFTRWWTRASPLWWEMSPPPPPWQLLPRAQITTCPWSLLPLPLRPLLTMPRPTP